MGWFGNWYRGQYIVCGIPGWSWVLLHYNTSSDLIKLDDGRSPTKALLNLILHHVKLVVLLICMSISRNQSLDFSFDSLLSEGIYLFKSI